VGMSVFLSASMAATSRSLLLATGIGFFIFASIELVLLEAMLGY
jgi:hypothetical protein